MNSVPDSGWVQDQVCKGAHRSRIVGKPFESEMKKRFFPSEQWTSGIYCNKKQLKAKIIKHIQEVDINLRAGGMRGQRENAGTRTEFGWSAMILLNDEGKLEGPDDPDRFLFAHIPALLMVKWSCFSDWSLIQLHHSSIIHYPWTQFTF